MPGRLKILCLGDSYTIGEGLPRKDSWPSQWRTLLATKGQGHVSLRMVARTGWTTRDLRDALQSASLAPAYDLVTLCIGVNNQYQGKSITEFRTELAELIQFALSKNGDNPSRLLGISIPDWSVSPFAKDRNRPKIAKRIDQFNTWNETAFRKIGATYADITTSSRRFEGKPSGFTKDQLHPSRQQVTAWLKAIHHTARPALKEAQNPRWSRALDSP